MARIYTKTGDRGETSLIGGRRVLKSDVRVDLYGSVDNLNCWLGEAVMRLRVPVHDQHLLQARSEMLATELETIQSRLFDLGALLADPERCLKVKEAREYLPAFSTTSLEAAIDRMENDLPPLKQFILPGGGLAGSALHQSRACCRRVERRAVAVDGDISIPRAVLEYLNRLADYLFVAARWMNQAAGVTELIYKPYADQAGD
jgi:cob(I)alamin adenosyltransferase